MMDAVISLCASENVTHQQVAVEALIHAAGKAKRASFITANGVALLKDLYKKSENEQIRVRALVVSIQLHHTGRLWFLNIIKECNNISIPSPHKLSWLVMWSKNTVKLLP